MYTTMIECNELTSSSNSNGYWSTTILQQNCDFACYYKIIPLSFARTFALANKSTKQLIA
jgi:hypothetical protein